VRAWVLSGSVATAISAAAPAIAQSPRVDTQISDRKVEVGDRFILQATISTEAGSATPGSPSLVVPPGITASAPNISTQQQVTISGGQVRQSHGVTATWGLSAIRPGTYRIGPPSFQVGASRVQGRVAMVEVVAAGTSPRPQRPAWPPDPFDLFRSPGFPAFPGFGFDPPGDADETLPPFPEELRIERASDPIAFLRARATPTRVVVGEQVTLAVDAYGSRGPFREVSSTEPSHPDFLSYAVVTDAHGEQHFRVPIGGQTWLAVKVREFALFPLHAGSLRIGAMDMGFDGRGYPGTSRQAGLRRSSDPIQISVVEPPVAGRPPGYRIGDVGRYKLTATVEPRQATQGDAVSVVVKLEGSGNLPHQLNTPQQRGIEWLEPAIAEDVEPQAGVLGGWRKFSYVVRLNQPGQIELGEIALPFWDPQRKAYDVTRAALGAVDVRHNPKLSTEKKANGSPAEIALAPRRELGAAPERRRYLGDRSWFWLLIGAGPLAVIALRGTTLLGRSLRDRWRARRDAHQTRANLALREAQAAAERNEPAAAASAVERAVHLAIEAKVDLRARGVLRNELAATLEARGISSDSAAEAVALLEACDTLRFTSDDALTPHALIDRASRLVLGLNRASPRPDAAARAPGSTA
jgi:hypothetical protein